jgi:hypothetical protein
VIILRAMKKDIAVVQRELRKHETNNLHSSPNKRIMRGVIT